jgi:hypothetical protein
MIRIPKNPAMITPSTNTRSDQPCWTCEHFGRPVLTDRERGPVWCEKNRFVNGRPEFGCCSWQRAPGSDDEPPT